MSLSRYTTPYTLLGHATLWDNEFSAQTCLVDSALNLP